MTSKKRTSEKTFILFSVISLSPLRYSVLSKNNVDTELQTLKASTSIGFTINPILNSYFSNPKVKNLKYSDKKSISKILEIKIQTIINSNTFEKAI
jgi:hypothetical protein